MVELVSIKTYKDAAAKNAGNKVNEAGDRIKNAGDKIKDNA